MQATEQSSWLLSLKYLDALESENALEAELDGKTYSFIIDKPYRWESWTTPKGSDGKLALQQRPAPQTPA